MNYWQRLNSEIENYQRQIAEIERQEQERAKRVLQQAIDAALMTSYGMAPHIRRKKPC